MFSAIRRRMHVSPATVIASLALVFAMTGGAYAAKKYLVTSTKQISPSVLKSLQGKAGAPGSNGAQGPAGPAGPAGPQGPGGSGGSEGKTGPAGTSATSSVEPKGVNCKEGGSKFLAASGATYACNGEKGKEGPPGPLLETLPAGKTLRGAFAAAGYAAEGITAGADFGKVKAAASFAFPVSAEPAFHYIPVGQGAGEGHESRFIVSGECTGTNEDPGAAEGQLCVFGRDEENLFNGSAGVTILLRGSPEATYGFAVGGVSASKGPMELDGTWAVTG